MTTSKILVCIAGFALTLTGCYDFNNPVDPAADNYQGFTSEQPTTAPAEITGLTATPVSPDTIRLDWNDVSTTNDTYRIERSEDGISYVERLPVGVLGATAETWEDKSLNQGTDYWYRVYTHRSSDSEESNPVEIGPVTSPSGTVPAAPGTLTIWMYASDPEHVLRLTWPDNSDNEEGFRIERRIPPGSFAEIDTVGTDITEYFDTTLSPDTTYEFRVCAYNIVGDSTYNTGPTWDTAPAAPSGLTGEPYLANQVRLKWIDESSTNDTYRIERSTDGITFSEREPAGVLAADAETWDDTGLPSSTDYWYRVYARRTSDSEESAPAEIGPLTSP